MLIGISGKIGSGKDTVGNIIQYLTALKKYPDIQPSYEEFSKLTQKEINYNASLDDSLSDFEIKKYADKLKDFICMLIGCTREQLEDQDFKNKVLPEEWWVYKVENFNDDEQYDIIGSYEDRYELLDSHNLDVEEHNKLYGDSDPKMTEEEFNKDFLVKTTPRLLLQIIGTECIRDKVHPNAWVNALFADYKYEIHRSEVPTRAAGFIDQHVYPNWIITDMRFPNEMEAVKSKGGITIRVNRSYDSLNQDSLFSLQKQQETNNHPSETSLDSATFDFVISNDKDIEHLINEVRKILEKLNII